MTVKSFPKVELEIDGSAAKIRLNRPEKKNALSPELHSGLSEALDYVDGLGHEIKVVVLTGTDDSFSSGMDLEKCFLEPFDDPDLYAAQSVVAESNFRRVKNLSAVTVAQVNGWAVGGGMELVGLCDIVVTAEEAQFGLSEINFGIFPAGGAMWATAHNLPRKQALYYALTGELFSGKEAVALGLATRAVPKAQLEEAVAEVVAQIQSKNAHALRAAKRAYEWSTKLDFDKSNEMELALNWELSHRTGGEWIREALTQFRERNYRPGLEAYKLPAQSEE